MSIVRTRHDKNNPFVMINKNGLCDSNLSLEAAGLLARLLCNREDWDIQVTQLSRVFRASEKKIYRVLNELIKNGYAYRQQLKDPITKKYLARELYVFETKDLCSEFKKCLPVSPFGEAVARDAACQGEKKSPLYIENNNNNDIFRSASPERENFSVKKIKKEPPEEAMSLATYFWGKIKSICPDQVAPNLGSWARDLDLLKRKSGKEWDDLKKVVDWVYDDAFWAKIINSASGLRKNYNSIILKMIPINNKGTIINQNLDAANSVKAALYQTGNIRDFVIHTNSVSNAKTGDSIKLDLPPKTFKDILCNWFNLREAKSEI